MKRTGKTGSLDRPARSFARPGYGQLYVAAVVALGAAAIVDCAMRLVREPVPASWLVLAALTWISGSFALKVPQVPASISVSETFVFMLLLLFGGPPATLTVAVDGLLTSAMRAGAPAAAAPVQHRGAGDLDVGRVACVRLGGGPGAARSARPTRSPRSCCRCS